jgi:hypothetical protein
MSTIKLFLCILCLAYLGSNELYRRNMLTRILTNTRQKTSRFTITEIARNEIGVRELTGHNDGPKVEAYLSTVKLKKGEPWCAAFVSWAYAKAGFPKPRSGWSPDLFPSSRLVRSALPGDVIGIYFPELGRIYSTEGNTTVAGSREGDGVFKRIRHIKTIRSIADWITERRKVK